MSVFGETHGATVAEAGGADAVADKMPRCSCLPFCFWRGSRFRRTESRGAEAAALGKRRRRRRRRFRLSWSWLAFAWPWLRRSGKKHDTATKTTTGKQRRGRQLLLLLKTSLQAKKALASVVVSGDSAGLLPATVSSFSDAKKQNRSKPRPTPDGTAPSGAIRQPQPSTTAMLGTGGSKAPARPGTNQPCTTATPDDRALVVTGAGRIWRDPSRRCYSLRQPDRAERPRGSGLWTAATTLGVIVLFGRVTAVVFLCSCLYGARFVWLRLPRAGASASAKSGGGGGSGAGSSRRFGDPVGVAAEKVAEVCVTEESKKKVVMAGLLERPGQRPSSRFGWRREAAWWPASRRGEARRMADDGSVGGVRRDEKGGRWRQRGRREARQRLLRAEERLAAGSCSPTDGGATGDEPHSAAGSGATVASIGSDGELQAPPLSFTSQRHPRIFVSVS